MVLSTSEVAFIEKQLLSIMKLNKVTKNMSYQLAQVAYEELQLFRQEARTPRQEGEAEEGRGED